MSNNTQLTHPIDHQLRKHVYGEVSVERSVMTFCEGTCLDWRPFPRRAFAPDPRADDISNEIRFIALTCLEEDLEKCQGHLVRVERFRGMLRSYSFTPPSDDWQFSGSLSITVMPWDEEAGHLSCKRVIRTRVFDYRCGESKLTVTADLGTSSLTARFSPWQPR